jgi:serine/threonine-protein kinase
MGEVYRATDQELGREVAVKVLAARYAEDENLRERFRRESLAAARLSSNPRIVTIFDVAVHEGRPMIVMELMPGGSLEQRAAGRGPLPPGQVLDWIEEAAVALDAAHEAGIVHRDVKPGNLLLDDGGHVKVADFGIASAAGLDSFTQAGTVLGTAGYLSPEQARGERAGAASDRYSLAVVAWELLAGSRPFASESPTAEAAAHVQTPVPSIHEANGDLPAGYDAIFRRALAKDPAARYGSAAELVGALRRGLHDDAGDTWVEAAPTRPIAPPAAAGNRRWWIPVLIVLLVAGGVLAAVLSSHGGGHKTASTERTVVKTVTTPGQTVRQTVTVATPPPPTTQPATTGASGAELNTAGYQKMQNGDYTGALPLLEQAVPKLQGTNTLDEAYTDYNLAYTRMALGQCTDVLALLDRSQQIQGHRPEIEQLRKDAKKQC